MAPRPHSCQCLNERLPAPLHSRALHVGDDETEVRVHDGPTVAIRGGFFLQGNIDHHGSCNSALLQHALGATDYLRIALAMASVMLAAYSVSNYRETRALWQMQRHALVKQIKVEHRVVPTRREMWLVRAARGWGLLHSPPVVDGQPVEPVMDSVPNAPNFGYLRNFVPWRAYLSPMQLNVEVSLVAAELVVVWGVLAVLAATTGIGDNPLEPLLRAREMLDSDIYYYYDYHLWIKLFTLTVVALSANAAAVLAAVLLYVIQALRSRRPDSRTDPRRKLTNFLFLWLTNAAGAAEFVLIFTFVGPPT